MDFFQEPTFTAFLAIILTLIVAKIVSFAVSSSNSDDSGVVCSVNEGSVAKEVILNKGLRVKKAKNKKKVKFAEDVEIRRVDLYEGSENLELVDDVIVEEKSVDEKNGVCEDLSEKVIEEQCLDMGEVKDGEPQEKGSEKVEMLIEKETGGENMNRVFSEKHETLMTSGLISEIIDEEKQNEAKLEDDVVTDQKEGNGLGCCEENEGKVRIESVDDEDDDWEGIERSELEKVFAEAVNYLEYGGKGKDKEDDDNKLAKLSSDVQMELYGLHKLAVEGPCHEPQPMALKVSARAKWNAWQKLGSMTQEAAMEQYIRVLSDSVPDWMHDYSADNDITGSPKSETIGEISDPEFESNFIHQQEIRTHCLSDW